MSWFCPARNALTSFPAVSPGSKDRLLFHTTLKAGKSKRYTLRLWVPAELAPGEYRLVAWARC